MVARVRKLARLDRQGRLFYSFKRKARARASPAATEIDGHRIPVEFNAATRPFSLRLTQHSAVQAVAAAALRWRSRMASMTHAHPRRISSTPIANPMNHSADAGQ